MIKHKKVLAMLTILILSLLFGCSNAEEKNANTLIYGSGNYTAINPALYEHGEINSLIFLGLTVHDAENRPVPGAAEKWSVDRNTYHFTLRQGLTFHDGKPLTASDVEFTINTIMNPKNRSENASNFEDITGVKVIDDLNLEITLKRPNSAILDYLSIGILPRHLLEGRDITSDAFNQNPVGAGPYKLEAWDKGQSITMVKNEDFCLGAPKIDKIVFKIVEDYDVRALQLKSGELDFTQITPKAIEQLKDSGFQINEMTTADYRAIMYNFAHPLFKSNPELPAALSYAIDRTAIVNSVLLGHGQAAYSPLQKSVYDNPNIQKYTYNPQKTKELLEASGWKRNADGIYEKNGQPLAFTINCSQGDRVRIDMAGLCAQYFRQIGAKVDVKTPAEIDWSGQSAFLIGWGSPFDPDDHTYKVFNTGKAANYNAYSNEHVDRLLQSAREKISTEERRPLYLEFQQQLAEDPAYTFLVYIDAIYAGKPNIKGINRDTVLGHHGVGIFWNIHQWEIMK